MKCRNRSVKNTPVAAVNALEAFMRNKTEASFADLRSSVPLLAAMTEGELQQAIIDAELEYDDLD